MSEYDRANQAARGGQRRAIEVLSRELGAVDTLRFINQFSTGYGNYTAERDIMFGQETLDQIITEIKGASPQEVT